MTINAMACASFIHWFRGLFPGRFIFQLYIILPLAWHYYVSRENWDLTYHIMELRITPFGVTSSLTICIRIYHAVIVVRLGFTRQTNRNNKKCDRYEVRCRIATDHSSKTIEDCCSSGFVMEELRIGSLSLPRTYWRLLLEWLRHSKGCCPILLQSNTYAANGLNRFHKLTPHKLARTPITQEIIIVGSGFVAEFPRLSHSKAMLMFERFRNSKWVTQTVRSEYCNGIWEG